MSQCITLTIAGSIRRLRNTALQVPLAVAAGLLLSIGAFAQTPPPLHQVAPRVAPIPGSAPGLPKFGLRAMLGGQPWVHFGPAALNAGETWSGRIAGIAAHPTDANTIYIAAAGGGVWKTTDGGTTWTALTDTQLTLAMGAIAIAPSNTSVIYAGTGEANNSQDSAYGYGILKSTNGGSTWSLMGASVFNLATIGKIAISPTDPNTVYVAVVPPGLPAGSYAYTYQTGIWKTTDGGSTWTNTTTSIATGPDYSDVVIDPHSGTIYIAVGAWYGDSHNGVYRSTNGGATWSAAGNFPISSSNGRISIALFPSTSSTAATLYAAIATPGGDLQAMEKSTDGGTTWTALSGVPTYLGGSGYAQGWYDNAIGVSPTNANNVFAGGSANGGSANIIESTDGGATWHDISSDGSGNTPHSDEHALVFDATGHLLSGSDGGIWRLNDAVPGSLAWESINGNLETIQFTGISLHPTNSHIAYGGSQDNGTEGTTGSLIWDLLVGGDGGHSRVDLSTPTTVYQIFTGPYIQRSDDSGATFTPKYSGLTNNGNFYVPYVMDPANTSRLLLGTKSLYETTNKGDSWTNKGSFSNPIDAIAVNGNTIYVADGGSYSNPNALFLSTNDAGSFTTITPAGVSTHFADIAVDPTNASHAIVVADRFSTAHVLTTTNAGASWTDISGNLPNLPCNAVKYDATKGILYVGTDMGVYSSTGNGTWTQVGIGLPNARVVDLDLNTSLGLLGAGTHGRSMWEISLNNPAPAISSLSPSSATAGGAAFTLTVNGSNFISGAVVKWNGTALTTTFVNSGQLTASVPASDIASAGTAGVTVTQNSQTSNTATFTINAGAAISSLSPSTTPAGRNTKFTLTVNGSNFVSGAVVKWNGTALTTTFVSAAKLTAAVPAANIATAGTAGVTVTQNSATSNTATFTINQLPVITSLAPTSTLAGGPTFTLTVNGRNFVSGAVVKWKVGATTTSLTTTFVSATKLTAVVPNTLIASAGTASITVTTVNGTSGAKSFPILVTQVSVLSANLTRNSTTGAYTAVVTLKNTGFNTASTVKVTASKLGAANTSTTLPVTVGSIAAGGTATPSLTYPSTAGAPGASVNLTVSGTFTGGTFKGTLKVTLPH